MTPAASGRLPQAGVAVVVSGILFSRSVRSSFASFTLAPSPSPGQTPPPFFLPSPPPATAGGRATDETENGGPGGGGQEQQPTQQRLPQPLLVRLQFAAQIQQLRSHCRRQYKLGDHLEFLVTKRTQTDDDEDDGPSMMTKAGTTMIAQGAAGGPGGGEMPPTRSTDGQSNADEDAGGGYSWGQQSGWAISVSSPSDAHEVITVRTPQTWNMNQWQQWQQLYLPKEHKQKQGRRHRDPTPTTAPLEEEGDNQGDDADDGRIPFMATTTKKRAKTTDVGEGRRVGGPPMVVDGGEDAAGSASGGNPHGPKAGKEKRLQAEQVVDFFLSALRRKVQGDVTSMDDDGPGWSETAESGMARVRDLLNTGTGVLDIAGGSGHVSMALGLRGIQSTVVDARSSVGKLPQRDRKLWNQRLKAEQHTTTRTTRTKHQRDEDQSSTHFSIVGGPGVPNRNDDQPNTLASGTHEEERPTIPYSRRNPTVMVCQPVGVVPFRTHRAWFGSKPSGVDATFRHPDEDSLPVVGGIPPPGGGDDAAITSSMLLLEGASALVALHPDEATGEVVLQAVRRRIPFCVVPCCVFARLFPDRQTTDGRPVSTYEDLLDYLQEQDPSIRLTKLSFEGRNIALWSTF
jgi:hypothetical protein